MRGVAGIGIASVDFFTVRSVCRRRGNLDVCRMRVEACPMPAATWRVTLKKLTIPAATVRLRFVVG